MVCLEQFVDDELEGGSNIRMENMEIKFRTGVVSHDRLDGAERGPEVFAVGAENDGRLFQ